MMSRFCIMVCAAVMAALLSRGGPFVAEAAGQGSDRPDSPHGYTELVETAISGQELEETKETQITIYTYSEEAYLINGKFSRRIER